MDFVRDPIFNFSNCLLISFVCSSSSKMASWGTPSTRRSISNIGFCPTSETEFRSSFLKLEEPGSSVVLPATSLFSVPTASSFLKLEDGVPESGCCCCCCCCEWQLLQSVTSGAGRGVESLSSSVRSPFWKITLLMQSAGTGLCTIIAVYFVCQNRHPWSCARDNFTQSTASWSCFQLLWWCTFPGIVKSSLGDSSSGCSPKGLRGVKNMVCRPSLLAMSPFSRMDWMLREQLLWNTNSFQSQGTKNVPHQFRCNSYSTRVSLNCSTTSQGIFGMIAICFWEISFSSVRERSQQFRFFRVPVNCCTRLSFFLIKMTHQSCNHFGDRCRKRSSLYYE